MDKKMTWEEMKKAYPNEWLLIADFELDKYGQVRSGVIKRHSPSKGPVYAKPSIKKPVAFRYTGESTFTGLRRYVSSSN